MKNPTFSVIIATYNWSSALRIALESVRGQSYTDFEVLVVGDACTDDSADVVASFNDERLHWHNLSKNHGSQWAPNNYGLSIAKGEYIAYLGHDDLWWPTHLETAYKTFQRTDADIVAAATLLYGPPESRVRAVTGFFPNDVFKPRYFFPPSSMLHRLELSKRVGGWRPPEEANVAVDTDFLVRCHESGARIASTGEFTTFKFNAAWRRDAYLLRDPQEQREFLTRMQKDGERFRFQEISDTLRAAVEDRLQKIEIPPSAQHKASHSAAINHNFKGTRCTGNTPKPILGNNGRRRYLPPDMYSGFEWHPIQQHSLLGSYRWSGPSRRSTIVLPEKIDGPTEITLLLLGWISEEVLGEASLSVNGMKLETTLEPGPNGAKLWKGRISTVNLPGLVVDDMHITIDVPETWRPIDFDLSEDRRWLGLAVGWIEIGSQGDKPSLPACNSRTSWSWH